MKWLRSKHVQTLCLRYRFDSWAQVKLSYTDLIGALVISWTHSLSVCVDVNVRYAQWEIGSASGFDCHPTVAADIGDSLASPPFFPNDSN